VIAIGIVAVIAARPALLQRFRQAPSAEAQPTSRRRRRLRLRQHRRALLCPDTSAPTHRRPHGGSRTSGLFDSDLGVIRAAETRLTDVNVKVEGWIRELYADYTGQPVTKGQPLFSLYSPDLLAWQREFVLAMKGRDQLRGSTQPDAIQRSESLVASSRRRLQLWDLPPEQIARLEQGLEPESTVTFHSPVSGFVLDKSAVAGLHVTPGQTLYRLADLGVVWIEADAYEHDLPVIRRGHRPRRADVPERRVLRVSSSSLHPSSRKPVPRRCASSCRTSDRLKPDVRER
jgi:hypothetical protein